MLTPELSRILALANESATDRSKRNVCAILARDYAQRHGLSDSDNSPTDPQSIQSARVSLIAAAWTFAQRPSSVTYSALMRSMFADDAAILSESDKRPANLMSATVHAPDVPAFHLQRVNPEALKWQTKPAMGVNPMYVAMLDQAVNKPKPRKRYKARLIANLSR